MSRQSNHSSAKAPVHNQQPPFGPCRRCGACCHQRPCTILVTVDDIDYWRENGLDELADNLTDGHFGQKAFPIGPKGACVYLGTREAPNDCRIHHNRAQVCRDFEPGCAQCLEFRRDLGIEDEPKGSM